MMTDQQVTTRVSARVARIRFQKLGKLYDFDCTDFPELAGGDYVIVETVRGRQMGQVMGFAAPTEQEDRDYKAILRIASARDMMLKDLWESRQLEALITCREKAHQLGGYEGCKFLEARYNYDGTMLTVLFSAEDNKINTNRLRQALSGIYKAKIELRQVGPRDVAKLIGGFGACGITRCCSTFLTDFSPISIKMAKAQGISLNPSEITGMCGRLRCCLVYEYEQYVEARKQLPKRNKRVGTPQGEGKVVDVHPLQDAVTVLIEDNFVLVKREELIPLDELDALQKKAQGGCSKHEGGGCDCQSHRPAKPVAADDEEDDEVAGLDD
ncbi:MAG: stage 0 sporulation family protein [Anaerolineae bacterium]|nr:stage 0 sporulation family protein [Anaerolineae bacterium]